MESLVQMLLNYMSDYPQMSIVLVVMAVARSIFKPICVVVQAYVDATVEPGDNEKWLKIQDNKVFKAFAFFLDMGLSIKIPEKPTK